MGSGEHSSDSVLSNNEFRISIKLGLIAISVRVVTGWQRPGKWQDLQGRSHPSDLRTGCTRGTRGRHRRLHEDVKSVTTKTS